MGDNQNISGNGWSGDVEEITPTFAKIAVRFPVERLLFLSPHLLTRTRDGYALDLSFAEVNEQTWDGPPLDTGYTGLPPL